MNTHRLIFDGMLDPFWFNAQRGKTHNGVVEPTGFVRLAAMTLRLKDPNALPAGTQVKIWLDRDFQCAAAEEITREAAHRAETEALEAEEHRLRMNRERAAAETFNGAIHLPVRWIPGMKDVLSGLSEQSNGDGCNRATVQHILLLEDLHDGRLRRRAGSFLCTSAGGSDGLRYSGQPEAMHVDGEGRLYPAKITCQACLQCASRWIKPAGPDARLSAVQQTLAGRDPARCPSP